MYFLDTRELSEHDTPASGVSGNMVAPAGVNSENLDITEAHPDLSQQNPASEVRTPRPVSP